MDLKKITRLADSLEKIFDNIEALPEKMAKKLEKPLLKLIFQYELREKDLYMQCAGTLQSTPVELHDGIALERKDKIQEHIPEYT